jgi:hypothetical protein
MGFMNSRQYASAQGEVSVFLLLIFNEISLIALFMHKLSSRLSKTAEQRLDGEGLVRHRSGLELFLKSPASCRLNDFSVNVVRRGSAIMPESSFFRH